MATAQAAKEEVVDNEPGDAGYAERDLQNRRDAHQLLQGMDVLPAFKPVRNEAMTKRVTGWRLSELRAARIAPPTTFCQFFSHTWWRRFVAWKLSFEDKCVTKQSLGPGSAGW